MKKIIFYPKMAFQSIKKNKKLYIPYIITCISMVMMFYLLTYLSSDSFIKMVPKGGETTQLILKLGKWVIGVFSALFLFYTNSFLIKHRKKEFGLYNVLGMNKQNIVQVLLYESGFIYLISIISGVILGILVSKISELVLVRMLSGEITYSLNISFSGINKTAVFYLVIFILILIKSILQVKMSNPIELLRSSSVGEKPVKSNWLLALAGVIILGISYYLAVKIDDPIKAISIFFIAVIMVIIATYILFISGSVALCKILQKSKKYYYKTNHFISLSSMAYRMKRNGAGLASIAIMSTMILVMLSSTSNLYIGAEDALASQYPRDIIFEANIDKVFDKEKEFDNDINQMMNQLNVKPDNIFKFNNLFVTGVKGDEENEILFPEKTIAGDNVSNIVLVGIIPINDYNNLSGKNITLGEREVLVQSDYYSGKGNINIGNLDDLIVKEEVDDVDKLTFSTFQMYEYTYIIGNENILNEIYQYEKQAYKDRASNIAYTYGFNINAEQDKQEEIYTKLNEFKNSNDFMSKYKDYSITLSSKAVQRNSFMSLYGILFFLGILLSIIFLLGTVLIMYYKQIVEGYEDKNRFDILQKVGMTKKEIRKSINSQVLTVFFMPLIVASIHTAFAFPLVRKMIMLFGVFNTPLLITVTLISIAIFAIFYSLIYKLTSKSYYNIVSDF